MAAISGALYHRLHISSSAGMYLYEFIFHIFNDFHKPELVTYQNKKTAQIMTYVFAAILESCFPLPGNICLYFIQCHHSQIVFPPLSLRNICIRRPRQRNTVLTLCNDPTREWMKYDRLQHKEDSKKFPVFKKTF